MVGPDLRVAPYTAEEAAAALATAYRNVLREFAAAPLRVLRLLPVSGGIFAGPYQGDIAALTFDALDAALKMLPQPTAQALATRRLTLCIFMESEYQAFLDAGFVEDALIRR